MNVIQAISAVMAELPAIGKTDQSTQVPYKFRGIETITAHLQPLLAKHGVVIVPAVAITSIDHSPAMKEGWQDVLSSVAWTIYGPEGDQIVATTAGIGRDNSDKGANKAQTQAYKYLLLHMFCIADPKDDADGVSYEHGMAPEEPAPPPPEFSEASLALYARVKAQKGTPIETELRELAAANNMRLTAAAFDKDAMWAEIVGATIDSAEHADRENAQHDAETSGTRP